MSEKTCVGNGRFFYFNDDDRLELFIYKKTCPADKNKSCVILIECHELNWN